MQTDSDGNALTAGKQDFPIQWMPRMKIKRAMWDHESMLQTNVY